MFVFLIRHLDGKLCWSLQINASKSIMKIKHTKKRHPHKLSANFHAHRTFRFNFYAIEVNNQNTIQPSPSRTKVFFTISTVHPCNGKRKVLRCGFYMLMHFHKLKRNEGTKKAGNQRMHDVSFEIAGFWFKQTQSNTVKHTHTHKAHAHTTQ